MPVVISSSKPTTYLLDELIIINIYKSFTHPSQNKQNIVSVINSSMSGEPNKTPIWELEGPALETWIRKIRSLYPGESTQLLIVHLAKIDGVIVISKLGFI